MNKFVCNGLLICLLSVTGCDGGDSRASAPSGPPVQPVGQAETPPPVPPPAPQPKPPVEWSAEDEAALKDAIDGRAIHGLEHMNFWPGWTASRPRSGRRC